MGLTVGSEVIINLAKIPTKLQDKLGSDTEGTIRQFSVINNVEYCTVNIYRECGGLPLLIDIPVKAVLEI